MNRTPPPEIRRLLRKEVAFGCPVGDCGNPYLEYHHFDPPWRAREHHEPVGMIALCAEHHRKADAGAFTREQLASLKASPTRAPVEGTFDWRRRRLLAKIGGNWYEGTAIILQVSNRRVIWFNRDREEHWLLNIDTSCLSREPRLQLVDNDWISFGGPSDFQCPPSGRKISATYQNGDRIEVVFSEVDDADTACSRHGLPTEYRAMIDFPVTLVEVTLRVAGFPVRYTPTKTEGPGFIMSGGFTKNCHCAVSV